MIEKMNELEKAAIESAEDCFECAYDDNHEGMKIVKEAFMYDAEWMSEIKTSVEEFNKLKSLE